MTQEGDSVPVDQRHGVPAKAPFKKPSKKVSKKVPKRAPAKAPIVERPPSRVTQVREGCVHDWQRVGFQEWSPVVIAVVYACERCSSYTYREMQFVGYRLDSLEDVLADQSSGGGG